MKSVILSFLLFFLSFTVLAGYSPNPCEQGTCPKPWGMDKQKILTSDVIKTKKKKTDD